MATSGSHQLPAPDERSATNAIAGSATTGVIGVGDAAMPSTTDAGCSVRRRSGGAAPAVSTLAGLSLRLGRSDGHFKYDGEALNQSLQAVQCPTR
jgi:hypothetical protein